MLRYLFALIAFCFFGWLTSTITGYVIVHDQTGLAESARISNGKLYQTLIKFPADYFVVIPEMEGGVEVRCSDGSMVKGGYATKHWRESLRVVGEGTCEELIQ